MNKELKKKWLKALRSGKYKQGKGALKREINQKKECAFCCLGVLCDIIDNTKWRTERTVYEYNNNGEVVSGVLPISLTSKYNIDVLQTNKLIDMNDIKNLDFNEIADYIESNF